MAIKDDKGLYRGVIGDLVFRVVHGKQVVQQRGMRRQTEPSKKSAQRFGTAQKEAAEVRKRLTPWLLGVGDSNMKRRFLTAAYRALMAHREAFPDTALSVYVNSMRGLEGFEFHEQAPLTAFFKVKPEVSGTVSGGLQVELPALLPQEAFVFPHYGYEVDLQLVAVHYTLDPAQADRTESWKVSFHKQQPLTAAMRFEVPPITSTGITLILLQLRYHSFQSVNGQVYKEDALWKPTQILFAD